MKSSEQYKLCKSNF